MVSESSDAGCLVSCSERESQRPLTTIGDSTATNNVIGDFPIFITTSFFPFSFTTLNTLLSEGFQQGD